MIEADEKQAERPFSIGARVRYWPDGKRYISVCVVGYTKTGRVRVRFPVNAAGYSQTSVVKLTSLSTI